MMLKFIYRNHREEIRERYVVPQQIEYLTGEVDEYGYQPGWFIRALDIEKNLTRSFSIERIIPREGERVLLSFLDLFERDSIMSVLEASKELVLSIEDDNLRHGDIISQETLLKVAKLRQILAFYNR